MPKVVGNGGSPALSAFEVQSGTRLVFGAGSVERVGELARSVGARRILLVTDPGLVRAGHGPRVERLLQSDGLDVVLFDQAKENPTTRCVEECVAVAQAARVDTIIGLGGGSSMDTAKGCNFLLTNGGQMRDYRGVGKAAKPMLPFLAIPTTAGTGSECQCAALIADEVTHEKMACLDRKALACVALLDPALTVSQPARVTAGTGMDALAHALETAVTTRRNPVSAMYSREAFRMLLGAFPRVLAGPDDLAARGAMLLGAAFAGTAIEHSMLGAAHAAANPLTAHFGIVHGEAVGLMLPGVIRFNAEHPAAGTAYVDLACAARLARPGDPPAAVALALAQQLESLCDQSGLPRRLAERGVERAAVPQLAQEAARQWTASFNPRPLTASDFERLYHAAFADGGLA